MVTLRLSLHKAENKSCVNAIYSEKKSMLSDTKRIWCWKEMLGFTSILVPHKFTKRGGLTKDREGKKISKTRIKIPGRFPLSNSVCMDTADLGMYHFLFIIHPPEAGQTSNVLRRVVRK